MQNTILKIRQKKKLVRTAETAVLTNFFNGPIFDLGLEIAFCNRPLRDFNTAGENIAVTWLR